ncbi:uncharacterized protein BDZ99DRAFT_56645 [Mytilinidion resinicola]|uniref:F1F0 ATP synthase assembly protein Atp10 n=1 Tax=Mytilinidion resinicola TaxID=574789 RepID=A0A6A6YI56_9PEZI|nr:uncharacterized protein BDZ99DRAFT_56645 [Mytilinidion resinicola]KAF2808481.1 hypothetical protein BDZ99DRAFT_56645 [Mytilinidion resinicola]
MLRPSFLLAFRSLALETPRPCIRCAFHPHRAAPRVTSNLRLFSSRPRLQTSEESSQDDDGFVPRALGRPIGFHYPPRPGENTGYDSRNLRQRKKDFTNYDRHIEKRKQLTAKIAKPYFRDFTMTKYREGKSFLANPKIFKSSAALYFPNLHGKTLASASPTDTTPVLKGKVSIVSVWSSLWGENQVKTFTGVDQNPGLQEFLKKNKEQAQRVDVHIEENLAKAWLVSLFQNRLRKQRAEEDWGKYFIVRKGIDESIRETIGILNGRVGYVYLLDEECKIRWAASGNAEEGEPETMMKGLQKLVDSVPVLNGGASKVDGKVKAVAATAAV